MNRRDYIRITGISTPSSPIKVLPSLGQISCMRWTPAFIIKVAPSGLFSTIELMSSPGKISIAPSSGVVPLTAENVILSIWDRGMEEKSPVII